MAGVWRWEQQKGDVGNTLRCWQKRPPCMTACRETETEMLIGSNLRVKTDTVR